MRLTTQLERFLMLLIIRYCSSLLELYGMLSGSEIFQLINSMVTMSVSISVIMLVSVAGEILFAH